MGNTAERCIKMRSVLLSGNTLATMFLNQLMIPWSFFRSETAMQAFVVDSSKLKDPKYHELILSSYGKILHEAICSMVSMVPREFVCVMLDKVSDRHSGTPYPTGVLDLRNPDQYFWSISISGNHIKSVYDHPDRIHSFVGLLVRYSKSTIKRQVFSQGERFNGVHRGNSLTAGVIDSKGQMPITAHGLNGGKRRKIYHPKGRIAGTVIADNPATDSALALLDPPFIATHRITHTSVPVIDDILHVHATQQSDAHNVVVRGMAVTDSYLIVADIVPPGTSEAGDCGAAYTTPRGSHLVGIHCEGHPAGSPNHSVRIIFANKFSFPDQGHCLELFLSVPSRSSLFISAMPIIIGVFILLVLKMTEAEAQLSLNIHRI